MPQLVYQIIDLFAAILRLLGMAAFGLAIGWLAMDLLRKFDAWPGKLSIFLGLAGLTIAMVVFLAGGALAAYSIGLAAAIFLWGMPRKKKEEEEEETKKKKRMRVNLLQVSLLPSAQYYCRSANSSQQRYERHH